MGLQRVCSGSLNHQTLLTAFTQPVRVHPLGPTPHSPGGATLVCVCVRAHAGPPRQRRVRGLSLSGDSAAHGFPSKRAFVCPSVYKYVFVCAGVRLLTRFRSLWGRRHFERFDLWTQTMSARRWRGISSRRATAQNGMTHTYGHLLWSIFNVQKFMQFISEYCYYCHNRYHE